jgi:regulator of cell morphogenesis and NO signaling
MSQGTITTTIVGSDSLNTIVARHPQALEVLQRFGLDTCCGGALPLRMAVEHHGLDLDEVVAALRAIAEESGR